MTTHSLAYRFSEEIFNHLGIIHKICRTYKKETADREDLFQEIVYNAWKAYPEFEGRSKFSTWLYRVALNTAMYQNRKDRFFGRTRGLEFVVNHPAAESNDTMRELWFAIEQLDPMEKSVVVLYLDELSYKEIAEVTGLTETNVGVKLNRIKSKIKKILINYGT